MGLLDALIYGVRDVLNSSFVPFVRKSRIALGAGLVGTVDEANDCITITAPGGGGASPGGSAGDTQINDGGGGFTGVGGDADDVLVYNGTAWAAADAAPLATLATTAASVPVTALTEQGAAYALVSGDRGSVVVATGASIKLPAARATGDTYSVVNGSGGDLTVDLNGGPGIYGEAGNETVADAESRTYIYDGVSLNKWVRA